MDSASTDEEDHLHSNDIDEIAEIGGVESTEMRPSYNSIYKYINNPEVYLVSALFIQRCLSVPAC